MLFISAWLVNSTHFITPGTSKQTAQRGVLDVIVFYADAPRDVERYPLQVRRELQRFLARARAYRRGHGRPGSDRKCRWCMRPAKVAKPSWWRQLPPQARLVSRSKYVDALRPCYEWEGFHDCPEREALFAEQHLRDRPDSPFRELLRVLAAHRWLCAAEGYEYEQKPTEALRAMRAYEEALKAATGDSRSALMTTAANELKASGRCHATHPFPKRRGGVSRDRTLSRSPLTFGSPASGSRRARVPVSAERATRSRNELHLGTTSVPLDGYSTCWTAGPVLLLARR